MYGTLWMKVRVSASFSVPRCNRPMCGSARWITSPSSSSTRRNTPCAAGCCGPKFMVKFWISPAISSALGRRLLGLALQPARVVPDHARHQYPGLDRDRLVDDPALFGGVAHFDVRAERENLTGRIVDEIGDCHHVVQGGGVPRNLCETDERVALS